MEYIQKEGYTEKRRRLERLSLQEGRIGYRAKKVLKEKKEQKEKEKYRCEKGPGKERKINGKTRKVMKFGRKYLGEPNTLQRKEEDKGVKKAQRKTKKLRALQYLCSQSIRIPWNSNIQ